MKSVAFWRDRDSQSSAVTRIRTWVVSATTRSTNHYTITAILPAGKLGDQTSTNTSDVYFYIGQSQLSLKVDELMSTELEHDKIDNSVILNHV